MENDTIIALATPFGQSAIAVIRLSGPASISILEDIFSSDLKGQPSHTIHYGSIRLGKKLVDKCLVSIFKAPHSYTKEDSIEISCHGSPFIIESIIKGCIERGARQAKKGEFTLRAFLNGQLDLSQAEAVADLIASDSSASHELAIKQLRGGISNELKLLRKKLINLASLVELELDFSEEDVEFASREDLEHTIMELLDKVTLLRNSFETGNALKHGIRTVIAGKPNAGKSTLLNAILNADRAIVSPIPGTTRDSIEDTITIEGVKFILTDTAGLRTSEDTIEEQGVKRSLDHISTCQLLLYVIDVNTSSPGQTFDELENLGLPHNRIILVLNKMDLNPTTDPSSYSRQELTSPKQVVPISAKNKMNIISLRENMKEMIANESLEDSTVITNARHFDSLNETSVALAKCLSGIAHGRSGDLLAMDLRHALHHLGEITGEIHTDDLLENIFSNFCIGK